MATITNEEEQQIHDKFIELASEGISVTQALARLKADLGKGSRKWLYTHPAWVEQFHEISKAYRYHSGQKREGKEKPGRLQRVATKPLDLATMPITIPPEWGTDREWRGVIIHEKSNPHDWEDLRLVDPQAQKAWTDFLAFLEQVRGERVELELWRFGLEMIKAWPMLYGIEPIYLGSWFVKLLNTEITEPRAVLLTGVHKALGDWLTRDKIALLTLIREKDVTEDYIKAYKDGNNHNGEGEQVGGGNEHVLDKDDAKSTCSE